MKIFVILLFTLFLFNCTISNMENEQFIKKESCDYSVCEEGRVSVDTLIDEIGVLRTKNDLYYVEVTGNAPEPDTLFISCTQEGIILPNENSYVVFSGLIKESCSEEMTPLKDSILLQEIELIDPIIQDNCQKQILSEGFDFHQIDEKLSIHHLEIKDGCLSMLVSFTGNCNQLPQLTLHHSTDILFGDGVMINVNLQGEIQEDCNVKNFLVLKCNITPMWDMLNYPYSTKITLYFQNQGYLRISN